MGAARPPQRPFPALRAVRGGGRCGERGPGCRLAEGKAERREPSACFFFSFFFSFFLSLPVPSVMVAAGCCLYCVCGAGLEGGPGAPGSCSLPAFLPAGSSGVCCQRGVRGRGTQVSARQKRLRETKPDGTLRTAGRDVRSILEW